MLSPKEEAPAPRLAETFGAVLSGTVKQKFNGLAIRVSTVYRGKKGKAFNLKNITLPENDEWHCVLFRAKILLFL